MEPKKKKNVLHSIFPLQHRIQSKFKSLKPLSFWDIFIVFIFSDIDILKDAVPLTYANTCLYSCN